MKVAAVQFAASQDAGENRRSIAELLYQLDESVDMVVLPEAIMVDFGEPDDDLAAIAEPMDGPFVELLADHARRLHATVIGGMFERTDDLPYNTLAVVGSDGTLQSSYRKIHLYDSFGYRESDRLRAGPREPLVVDVAGTAVGLMTCYDLRFPEMARALVDRGAEVLVAPTAWVAGTRKLHHWRVLTEARAIENTVHLVAAAQGGRRYTGHSRIIDPWGDVAAEADADNEILLATLDSEVLRHAREVNPSLANRRWNN